MCTYRLWLIRLLDPEPLLCRIEKRDLLLLHLRPTLVRAGDTVIKERPAIRFHPWRDGADGLSRRAGLDRLRLEQAPAGGK